MKKQLEGTAYPVSKNTVKDVLFSYVQREHRGLLCYHKRSTEELKGFMRDRKIHHSHTPTCKAPISILVYEDRELAFKRFLDLPN